MIKYFLIFLYRGLLNNKLFTLLNIVGLALGFTAFILAYQYINREKSYDRWNSNYENIYRVGLTYEGKHIAQTPSSLAKAIQRQLPEIKEVGLVLDYNYSNYPIFGKETINVRKTLLMDSSAAKIFQIEAETGPLYRSSQQKEASLVSKDLGRQLFGTNDIDFSTPQQVAVLSKALGVTENIYGISKARGLSIINYDLLLIKELEGEQHGNPYNYHTYIQVSSETKIPQLTEKINQIYHDQVTQLSWTKHSSFAKGEIYLDPLSHLHLRPKDGSNGAYLTIWILGILSILTLTLSAINFTNLTLAQAESRTKEMGIKKMFGSSTWSITLQLLAEVFTQCLVAALLALFIIALSGNLLYTFLNDDLINYLFHPVTIIQLSLAVAITTIIAGLYPSLILAGYKTKTTIKSKLQTHPNRNFLRNSLLTFQFFIALLFLCGSMLVYQQMQFIKKTDKGFDVEQVISFKGVGLYYDAKPDGTFYDFKRRIQQNPAIISISSATNLPGGADIPPKKQFNYQSRPIELDHIGVDPGYFNTLNIESIAGASQVSLEQLLKDSTTHYAVINETAAKELGIESPNGIKISGCEADFTVTAIIKDVMAYGFESKVAPTIYSYGEDCGPGQLKTSMILKAKAGRVKEAIEAVREEWIKNPSTESLPLDYEFLDATYAQLYAKQEQMETLLNGYTILSLFIAMLGLFGVSAYDVSVRNKEISIRKVLGASSRDIMLHLHKPYLYVLTLASIIGIPISYLLMRDWLNNFAYKVQISPWVFVFGVGSIALVLSIIVGLQSLKAAKTNPIDSLRDE
ncbi:MAG: FtsX-like permease family protein [Sphingobacterium sp.]|jgi:putative ABC transport system permease protein|nr:FtsX-like permease family protein [Sphingobacterium sp.]